MVLPVDNDEKLKAYVSIKLDGCLIVRDMKVIKGTSGYFVAMPAKKMKDGTYKDLVHPLDKPTREMLEQEVLNEYMRTTQGETSGEAATPHPDHDQARSRKRA